MHFLFTERRYWERSETHTFVPERDPDFRRLARSGTGRVRTFVHVWLTDEAGAAQYVGGLWARGNGLTRASVRRLVQAVVRCAGAERARPLLARLSRHLARFRHDRVTTATP